MARGPLTIWAMTTPEPVRFPSLLPRPSCRERHAAGCLDPGDPTDDIEVQVMPPIRLPPCNTRREGAPGFTRLPVRGAAPPRRARERELDQSQADAARSQSQEGKGEMALAFPMLSITGIVFFFWGVRQLGVTSWLWSSVDKKKRCL